MCWSCYSFYRSYFCFCWSCFAASTGVVSAKQLLLELLLVFLAKFPLLENYMFSLYIILVSNRLVG